MILPPVQRIVGYSNNKCTIVFKWDISMQQGQSGSSEFSLFNTKNSATAS